MVELVDCLGGTESSSRNSMKPSERGNDTLDFSVTKVENIVTFMDSLNSLDMLNDIKLEKKDSKEDKYKGKSALEFSLSVFKRLSNKDSEQTKKSFQTNKRGDDKTPVQEKNEEVEEPLPDVKELTKRIRDVEKYFAIKLQRWYRRAIKGKPRIPRPAIIPLITQDRDSSLEGRRHIKTLSVTFETITHNNKFTPKESLPTIESLGLGKIGGISRAISNNQAILVNDYQDNNTLNELARAYSSPKNQIPTLALKERASLASLALVRYSSSLGHIPSHNDSREFDQQSPMSKGSRSTKTRIDDKTPYNSGRNSSRKRLSRKHSKKYRPGFKEMYNEFTANNSQYITSRNSLVRSKSLEDVSLKYDVKKLPEDLNNTGNLKLMRRLTELKDLQNTHLRFNKAFMSKDEVWIFKYESYIWMKDNETKNLILYFQLRNSSKASVNFVIPFLDSEPVTSEKFISIWPVVMPSICQWYQDNGLEDEYTAYEAEFLQNFPKIMYKKTEKAMTLRGSKGPSLLTHEDKKVFQEIQKRIIFLIDKKLILVTKVNGKTLMIGSSSLGESVQVVYKEKVNKIQKEKKQKKLLAVDPKAVSEVVPSEEPNTVKNILEIENNCIESRILYLLTIDLLIEYSDAEFKKTKEEADCK